jgi:hypothetical protein
MTGPAPTRLDRDAGDADDPPGGAPDGGGGTLAIPELDDDVDEHLADTPTCAADEAVDPLEEIDAAQDGAAQHQLTFRDLLDTLGYAAAERISICHAPAGKNAPFQAKVLRVDQAPAEAARHAQDNTWFSINTVDGVAPGARGTVQQVQRLVALAGDLDRKNDGGMPSYDAIYKVIDDLSDILGVRPAVNINSGHGGQPIWTFDCNDPATDLTVGENRLDAVALYRRFGRLVRAVAERHGGDVDTTWDLARVWRVPGTLNVKNPDNPVPVTAVLGGGPLCEPDPYGEDDDPLTVDAVLDALDTYGIRTYAEDRELLGDVVAPPGEWRWGRTCTYVATMIDAWKREGPKKKIGRHPSLLARAVRLAAAHRLGCITEADCTAALERSSAQFKAWCENGVCGEKRPVARNEIRDIFSWGVTKVATMDDARVRKELDAKDGAGHRHEECDNPLEGILYPTGGAPTGNTSSAQQATSSPGAAPTAAPSLPPTVDVTGLWDRPVMQHLRTYAQSKMVSPLGALGAALSRVLAMLPPGYVLPDAVVADGSLNFYCALVGRSGGGKGGPDAVAARALHPVTGRADKELTELDNWADPVGGGPLYTAELGSGEGFGHAYVRLQKTEGKGEKELKQVRASVLYLSPEIDWLRGVGVRQGSTITSVLRKSWSGEALNPQFAAVDKRVRLDEHSYRVALTVGVQPKRADVLLDDADGGLPQRFIWMPVVDPDAPDPEPPTPPRPWRVRIPSPPAGRQPITVCPEAIQEIKAAGRARLLGRGDDLDTHALFCREKVAAGLALLDGHLIKEGVTSEDWELAGLVMKVSDATRGWVLDVRREQQAKANRARGQAEGERELTKRSVIDQQELERAVGAVRRKLARERDWVTHGKLRAAVHLDIRKWADDAIDTLVTTGDVDIEDYVYQGQQTTRYRARS